MTIESTIANETMTAATGNATGAAMSFSAKDTTNAFTSVNNDEEAAASSNNTNKTSTPSMEAYPPILPPQATDMVGANVLLQDKQPSLKPSNDDANDEQAVAASSSKTTASRKHKNDSLTFTTQALQAIWKVVHENQGSGEEDCNAQPSSNSTLLLQAVQQTTTVLMQAYDTTIIQPATKAMMELDQIKKENVGLKQKLVVKTREVQRLQSSETQSKASIANLLKAMETSNEESRQNAQTKLVEAKLRADCMHATMQRDEFQSQLLQEKHRNDLLKNDLDHYKNKANKLQTAKAQLDRDYHNAQAMVGSVQGSVNMDVEYHKRKITEYETWHKSQQSLLAKKNREIAELTKERNRLLSQNRLEQLKRAGGIMGGDSSNKKHRISY